MSPKGASKRKKARNTTEEDEVDEEEVFGVPRVMAEEQCDALGMLTQTLAQLAERMGASEARERERVEIERELLRPCPTLGLIRLLRSRTRTYPSAKCDPLH